MELVHVRASSLADLFDCPARWEAQHINKVRRPSSWAACLGHAVHAGAAVYDQAVIDGNPLTADEAAGAVVDEIQNPVDDVDWEDMSKPAVERIALPLHKIYCSQIAPRQKYLAVEATCDDLTITDIGIVLTGTVDRIRKTDDGYGIVDIKTGRSAVSSSGAVATKAHAAQMGVYELLAGQSLGVPMSAPAQIVGLQVAKTDKGRRSGVGEIHGAKNLLLGDEDHPGLLQIASRLIHGGFFYGNPKSQVCHPTYCPIYGVCRWRR